MMGGGKTCVYCTTVNLDDCLNSTTTVTYTPPLNTQTDRGVRKAANYQLDLGENIQQVMEHSGRHTIHIEHPKCTAGDPDLSIKSTHSSKGQNTLAAD